jgi:HPt (histidine-containing phosphotransfer) domain-containing protein
MAEPDKRAKHDGRGDRTGRGASDHDTSRDDDDLPVLDTDAIERLLAMIDAVERPGEDALGHLVELFARDGRVLLDEVASGWGRATRADREAAARAAHTLKGAAANLGAARVAAVCVVLERHCVDAPVRPELLQRVTSEVERAVAALRALQAARRHP